MIISSIINFQKIKNILNKDTAQQIFTFCIKGSNKNIRKYLLFNNIDYKNKEEIKKLFIETKTSLGQNIFHVLFKYNQIKTYYFVESLIANKKFIKQCLIKKDKNEGYINI